MAAPHQWTDEQTAMLRTGRAAHLTWDEVAAVVGVGRTGCRAHAIKIGIKGRHVVVRPEYVLTERDLAGADPLPAGHPIAWEMLALHGEGYSG